MDRTSLLIYGASGHAKVVLDAALRTNQYQLLGLLDDNLNSREASLHDIPLLEGEEALKQPEYQRCQLVVAVGANEVRERLAGRANELGYTFAIVVHPSAQLAQGATVGAGTVVLAGAVINTDAHLGGHVIVNTGATVDHDCVIESFAHLSPGVHLAGGVTVGRLAHIGIGASAIPGVTIGEGSIIGAGAAVVHDIPAHVTAVGVPARIIKHHRR